MIKSRISHTLLFSLLICLFLAACSHQPSTTSVYIEHDNPLEALDNALASAKANDKRLAVVLGAQWCHDSRGFADTLTTPQMEQIVDKSYEVLYLDVGYYKDLRMVTQRFGQPIYFATPTVMIVDPVSETLLNASDMHIWGSADSLSLSTYTDNFTKYAKTEALQIAKQQQSKLSADANNKIDDFATFQAERLFDAYQVLVPGMIEEDKTKKTNDEFTAKWIEVRNFRMRLQKDLQALREQAISNPNAEVDLPVYMPFSWQ
jgi:hypothetical protein